MDIPNRSEIEKYIYYETENGILFNGDCVKILPFIENKSIDLVLTDYPYGEVNRPSNGLLNLDRGDADIMNVNLEHITQTLIDKTKGTFIVWCGYNQLSTIFKLFNKNKLSFRLLIWEKKNPVPMNGKRLYVSGVEIACYGKKPKAVFNAFCKNTVFRYPIERGEHPTVKNINLFKEIISDTTNAGDLVLDTFFGSGTTGVACERLNRRWIGIEISEKYCAIAKKRIEKELKQLKLFK